MNKNNLWVAAALVSVAVLVSGCGSSEAADEDEAVELTRRQKDTIVSELPVRGAGGVGRAMDAVDQADARAAQHDSLAAR